MTFNRSSRGQLLLSVAVGFALLCTMDLQAAAQSESSSLPAGPPPMPPPTMEIPPPPKLHCGKCMPL
jgi:hypothetical protein